MTFPSRHAAYVVFGVMTLAGCGGHSMGIVPGGSATSAFIRQRTFEYTGNVQDFTVPPNVKQITVVARGASGGGLNRHGGRPGRVRAVIPVTPGETLVVTVGGTPSGNAGGFNGGANGGPGIYCKTKCVGFGGGGASDVREHGSGLDKRILIAAGGGGMGGSWADHIRGGYGGSGGAPTGGPGGGGRHKCVGGSNCTAGIGGEGGARHKGGPGGAGGSCPFAVGHSGAPGEFGGGGAGGEGASGTSTDGSPGGGGGGGGYYGGGGGGAGSFHFFYTGERCAVAAGGGGGGSSYQEPTATNVRFWSGWRRATGNGLVVFSWK